MRKMKYYVPENIDLDEIERRNPEVFTGKRKLRKVNFICTLDAIVSSRAINRKKMNDRGLELTSMSSEILDGLVHNYKAYLEFLELEGIIEVNHSYQPGSNCKGYAFSEKYRYSNLKEYIIEDKRLEKARLRQQAKYVEDKKKETAEYDYLTKWCDDGKLQIDVERGLRWTEEDAQYKLYAVMGNEHLYKDIWRALGNVFETEQDFKTMVRSINTRKHNYSCRDAAKRFYNVFSFLKKGLRQYMTYDGKPLIEVDICNSQPTLVLCLADPYFWEPYDSKKGNKLNLQFLLPGIYDDVIASSSYNTVSMLLKNDKLRNSNSFQRFKTAVLGKQFYEDIEKHFHQLLPRSFRNRSETKVEFLRILFSNPKLHFLDCYIQCREFGKMYPELYEFLNSIQLLQKNLLPLLLQRVESFLVLGTVCKRISQEYPQIPLFPLHDSIISTEGNELVIEEILSQEIQIWTGNTQHLKVKKLSN